MATLPFHLPLSSSRIAVIGAGAAGLAAARIFNKAGYHVTVYEANAHIGGTWAYTNAARIQSAMYESLRTNLPVQIMQYSELPFPKHVNSFAPHTDVLKYLEAYCEEFSLKRMIKFNCLVQSVSKSSSDSWTVVTEAGVDGLHSEQFDAVLVCNGHYSTPNEWSVPGLERFRSSNLVTHSCYYRTSKPFVGKTVLLIGCGPSAVDLSLDVSKVARKVYVSHRRNKPIFSNFNIPHLSDAPLVLRMEDNDAVLEDGRTLRAIEAIIACTGYKYEFPFLKQGTAGVSVGSDGRVVEGLIRQLYAKDDPTLAFIGLPWSILPFPLFEDQLHYLLGLYSGKFSLSHEEFEEEAKAEEDLREEKGIYYHKLSDSQWEYRRDFACAAGRKPVQSSTIAIYHDVRLLRQSDCAGYRQAQYAILGDGPEDWRCTLDGVDITGSHES